MRTVGVRDGIWVNDQYYILATSARATGRSAVLKCGDTFAVFDRTGDIGGPDEHGLYHDGTRHLSMLTLGVGRDLPLLLSSRTSSNNELFGADLTNPDVLEGDAINYSQQRVSLEVSIHLAADFVDIFEVRGTRRARRGTRLPTHVEATTVELAYHGLDDLVRRTRLTFDPAPAVLTESSATYTIALDPHESTVAEITVTCAATVGPADPPFDAAFALIEQRSRRLQSEYARVSTSNQQFNGWINQSLADVRLMTSGQRRTGRRTRQDPARDPRRGDGNSRRSAVRTLLR